MEKELNEKKISIIYTNYRGETRLREILPIKIWFGKTDWHPDEQWLLEAYDLGKEDNRTFAMKDIRSWF